MNRKAHGHIGPNIAARCLCGYLPLCRKYPAEAHDSVLVRILLHTVQHLSNKDNMIAGPDPGRAGPGFLSFFDSADAASFPVPYLYIAGI